ncbi:hypothetical protein [Streptomyces sp. NPDC048527]|uniref:hypothetical protein n=1 Tax=Streptomyces sp. NPDC048527 TaxID=3365568 RepID=UPI00372219E0
MAAPQQTPTRRASDILGSPVLSGLLGLAGLVGPVIGSLTEHAQLTKILLAVEAVVIVLLVANIVYIRRAYIQLRRTNNLKLMDDAAYYDSVRAHLEQELISDYGEIADGHLRVWASEVPRLSVLLVNTLTETSSLPKRLLASDLTTNPSLLTQRRDYLRANRRLIEAGGTIDRLFICKADDLTQPDFARDLLELINHHRGLGVTCGLAVRDRLHADQAVDVVVFAAAAALVEEEQGDAGYTTGRSSVYFKGIERWTGRFESVWGHGSDAAPQVLQRYETAARPLLDADTWDTDRVKRAVEDL